MGASSSRWGSREGTGLALFPSWKAIDCKDGRHATLTLHKEEKRSQHPPALRRGMPRGRKRYGTLSIGRCPAVVCRWIARCAGRQNPTRIDLLSLSDVGADGPISLDGAMGLLDQARQCGITAGQFLSYLQPLAGPNLLNTYPLVGPVARPPPSQTAIAPYYLMYTPKFLAAARACHCVIAGHERALIGSLGHFDFYYQCRVGRVWLRRRPGLPRSRCTKFKRPVADWSPALTRPRAITRKVFSLLHYSRCSAFP